ncbi:hypothetical protein K1W69_17480 [Hoeflea sp. WL0058]|uniref:Uncharacterized protein n=1 Tax=Flavimaribacter sediminis TaxID=2865987 RepID=A0AAE3D2D9_9HYPH|nr:hypothetical protein [Flavimaribacter sediminis]MBW8638992.1 hypothetical protein [Flavimaribacter sediminis]
MALIDRVRERTGSDLSDTELQAMIDGILAEISARFGPAGAITVDIGDPGDPHSRRDRSLRLSRPIDTGETITITEIDPRHTGDASAETLLSDDDYRVLHGGHTIERLVGGTNGRDRWAPLVRITYTPSDITGAAREEAVIKLMLVDLSNRGLLKSERAGDYAFTLGDPSQERERILASLTARSGTVLA